MVDEVEEEVTMEAEQANIMMVEDTDKKPEEIQITLEKKDCNKRQYNPGQSRTITGNNGQEMQAHLSYQFNSNIWAKILSHGQD